MGIGFVARDCDGLVHGGAMQTTCNVVDPAWGELAALISGIVWAMDKGLTHVTFKGDSASIINKIKTGQEDITTLGFKIKEGVRLLNTRNEYNIRWCHRSCNSVADTLSNFALNNDCNNFFEMDIPEIIHNLIIQDSL